jgi:hypothetical protein
MILVLSQVMMSCLDLPDRFWLADFLISSIAVPVGSFLLQVSFLGVHVGLPAAGKVGHFLQRLLWSDQTGPASAAWALNCARYTAISLCWSFWC